MQQTNRFKTRKQKLNYLKGLLEERNTIDEIMPFKFYFFIHTNEQGVFYHGHFPDYEIPYLVNGKVKRYTENEIDELRKKPNVMCSKSEFTGYRPTFEELEARAKR